LALAAVQTQPGPIDPSRPSSEYDMMREEWETIHDIMQGLRYVRRRTGRYLPKYERESNDEYRRRNQCAPWRPEFLDIVTGLASRPFNKEVILKGSIPDIIIGVLNSANERCDGLVDNIDGRGNSLTVFARSVFTEAIANGYHAILVDFPMIDPAPNVALERAAGAMPYWVSIPARNIIALYTDFENGKEVIQHARIRERIIRRDRYQETVVEQVRVLEPGHWEIWERDEAGQLKMVNEGVLNRNGDTSVPLVLFFTGRREGTILVRPPLADLALMQIELYQALSRQEEILTFAGSPMLAANGMSPPKDGQVIEVGPKTVLFAPHSNVEGGRPHWAFVQPDAANIREVRDSVQSIQDNMRRLGMQPLIDKGAGATATGQLLGSTRANVALKAWALMFNDSLEQAFKFTAEWLGLSPTIETEVSTDFSVQPYAQYPLQSLAAARGTGDLSRETYWEGLRRFEVLPQDFDAEAEQKLLDAERALEPDELRVPSVIDENVNVRL
jgi:hypothetical protein